MNTMKKPMMNKKVLSLFLVVLVLSMPFTYAAFISDVVASGSLGVRDVISQNDTVSFEVVVDVSSPADQGVTPSLLANDNVLLVRGSEEHSFTDCSWKSEANRLISCTKSLQITTNPLQGLYYYDVLLGGNVYTPQPFLFVDSTPPLFSETVVSARQAGDRLNVTVSSVDVSDSTDIRCSGLQKFVARIGTSVIGEASFPPSTSCSGVASGLFPLSAQHASADSVCVTVFDRLNNNVTKCTSLSIDVSAPVISDQKLILNDFSGNELRAVGENGGFAKARFTVTDNVRLGEAYVTVSGSVKRATCSVISQFENGRTYQCDSEVFEVSSGTFSAEIVAIDTSGNRATAVLSKGLLADTTGPVFERIPTQTRNNVLYVRPGSDVFVEFTDTSLYDAALNMFIGSQSISASTCSIIGTNRWSCRFRIGNILNGEYPLDFSGRDDFGNTYTQVNLPYYVVVDSTPPSIGSVNITGVVEREVPVPVSQGRVKLTIPISSASPVNITADFSPLLRPNGNFDPTYNIVSSSCSETSCVVTSNIIGATSQKIIPITLRDLAGNVAEFDVTIPVRVTSDSEYDFTSRVLVSPSALDRSIAELVAQRAFASIEILDPLGQIQDFVSVDFRRCTAVPDDDMGPRQGGMEFLQGPITQVAKEDQRSFLSLQVMQSNDFFIDSIAVNCLFDVTAYSADTLYLDEQVIVPLIIPFFDNPIGYPDKKLSQKIEDAVEETGGMFETIDKIYKFVRIIERLCSVFTAIRGIITTVNATLQSIGVLCRAAMAIPFLGVSCEATSGTLCVKNEGATEKVDGFFGSGSFLGKFCAFMSCQINFCGGSGWNMVTGATSMFSDMGDSFEPETQAEIRNNLDNAGGVVARAAIANGISIWDPNGLPYQICHLCIPGILRKFHDYRQIQCAYALCLIEQTSQGFLSEEACDELKSTMECKFWAGELFSLLPFVYLWDMILDTIAMMIADPIAALFGLTAMYCVIFCPENTLGATICSAGYTLKRLTSLINTVMNIGDMFKNMLNFKDTQADACEEMDRAYSRFKSEQKTFDQRLAARSGGGTR